MLHGNGRNIMCLTTCIYFTEKPNQTYIKKELQNHDMVVHALILLLRRLRQDNSKVVASPGYIEKPCLKEAKVKRSEESWMWTVLYSVVPALLHFWLTGASSEPSGQSTSPSHCHRAFTRQRPSAHWNSPVPHCRYPRKEEASLLLYFYYRNKSALHPLRAQYTQSTRRQPGPLRKILISFHYCLKKCLLCDSRDKG